ncbi:MAG: hypothetical protein MI867_15495 [Pseudomonadales bacterium]|nr:hypothetical protein [Pseudomonadales bacterium]
MGRKYRGEHACIGQIHRLFEESCTELFQGLGCNIKQIEAPDDQSEQVPIAVIDAGSSELEVVVLMLLPVRVLALTYPTREEIITVFETTLEDWISELSNQLIGKLKNRLLNYGITLQLGLPAAYFGDELENLMPNHGHLEHFYFNVDNQLFECVVSIDFLSDVLELVCQTDNDNNINTGDLELF